MIDPERLHRDALVIDGHADTPQRFTDEDWNFGDELGTGHINLEAARRGGLDAEFFIAWAEPEQWHGRYAFRTLQLIDSVHEQVRRYSDAMQLALTPGDIVQAHKENKFAALIGIEGGHSIENDLGLLRMYHQLGARYLTLTWANSNEWAESSGALPAPDGSHPEGLTRFGRDVVREMNRLGMMVDLSHASDRTFWDTLETTRAPIIASHSSARALTDSPRNLTDEQLRAVATNNGIVMVNFYPAFIDEAWRTAWLATHDEREALYEAAQAPYKARRQPVPYEVMQAVDRHFYEEHLRTTVARPAFATLIDHFDHIARTAGVDHVGMGSDFDGISCLPEGLNTAANLPRITAALADRGYTENQLRKLLGENLLRVFGEVEGSAHPS